jgi:type IV pilus assembly protein PilE
MNNFHHDTGTCSSGRNNSLLSFNKRQRGFSLMELLIVLAIIGVIAGIGYPSYIEQVTNSKRKVAASCLTEYAGYMERFYSTNMTYATAPDADLNCLTDNNMDQIYDFDIAAQTATTYSLTATPQGNQAGRDTKCGTLSINQTGTRGVSGSAGADACW